MHGAQIAGLGSTPPRANATQHAENRQLLAFRIARHIDEHGFTSVPDLSYSLMLKQKPVSLALAHAMDEGIVERAAVRQARPNHEIRARLHVALEAADATAPYPLHAIREHLSRLGAHNVCYTQLRIALWDHERESAPKQFDLGMG